MSHELRSPLAAILGYTRLLRGKVDPSNPLIKYINTIDSSGQHLSAQIDDILEVSKIEAGQIELNPVRFDFSKLIEDIKAIVQGQASEKRLQLIIEKQEDMPGKLIGDEAKIRQILVNLLSNAIKFTGAGTVTLRLHCKDNLGLELVMAVEDTGDGISTEEIDKLFQPFGQTKFGRSKGGTGLGLVISRQYAQLMGGDLIVSSEVGKGSVFTCTCRVEIDPTPDYCEWRTEKRSITILAPGLQQKTILIADDHQELRFFVKQLLNEVGFVTREAGDGVEALSIIDAEPIDLVIMDIQMPEMNGYQAISRLRETTRGRNLPIIGFSASAFEEDRINVLASGADDFLSKPVNEAELFEKIGRLLGIGYCYS